MNRVLLNKIHELKNEFPQKSKDFEEFEFEALYREEETASNFWKALVLTWGSLFLYTSIKGPLPLLRREGRIFGTHRVVRHYLYSLALVGYFTYGKYYQSLHRTVDRLDEVKAYFKSIEDGYIVPTKPMRYNFKM